VNKTSSHHITRITLTDYRNYAALRLEPPSGLIALVGANGAGKTNMLEAVSLLTPGRGLRGAAFQSIGRNEGKGAWAVSAATAALHGEIQLGTAWSVSEAEGMNAARAVLVNGHLQKSRINRFEKLMRDRNLLLADGPYDRAWVGSLEMQMAEAAVAIAAARLQSISNLGAYLTPQRLSGPFPWSLLSISGEIEAMVAALPALDAEERYKKKLADGRSADKAAGRTLVGPHRSDFMVRHGPKNIAAEEGSTGEQKALLIGLILAQTEAIRAVTGAAPLLLLDEIAAHLDKARRTALFAHLGQLKVQAWMTGTERELFDGASATTVVYHVDNGRLSESKSH
jgi:DNA replication and repair protein RecF